MCVCHSGGTRTYLGILVTVVICRTIVDLHQKSDDAAAAGVHARDNAIACDLPGSGDRLPEIMP